MQHLYGDRFDVRIDAPVRLVSAAYLFQSEKFSHHFLQTSASLLFLDRSGRSATASRLVAFFNQAVRGTPIGTITDNLRQRFKIRRTGLRGPVV